jgi:hypothetical protein
MVVGVGYPLAFTLATALAIWSARASEVLDDARLDLDISPLLVTFSSSYWDWRRLPSAS